jgi:hypothetical protein
VSGQEFGDEVFFSDGEFFFGDVSRELDHFHAVHERCGDGIGDIGCGDKQYL